MPVYELPQADLQNDPAAEQKLAKAYDLATSKHLQEALGLAGEGPFLVVTMKPALSFLHEQRAQFYPPELIGMSDVDENAAYRQYTLEVATRSRGNVDAVLDLSAVPLAQLAPFVGRYLRTLRKVQSWAGRIAGDAGIMARDACAEEGATLAASPESSGHLVRIQPAQPAPATQSPAATP